MPGVTSNIRFTRLPKSVEEFWEDLYDLEDKVRDWGLMLTLSGSAMSETKWGSISVHGYQLCDDRSPPYVHTHSYGIWTQFPVDYNWFFELPAMLRDMLLEQGHAVSASTGDNVTHVLHVSGAKGFKEHPGAKPISFAIRSSDEEAYLRYLRGDFGKLKMTDITGEYDIDLHP